MPHRARTMVQRLARATAVAGSCATGQPQELRGESHRTHATRARSGDRRRRVTLADRGDAAAAMLDQDETGASVAGYDLCTAPGSRCSRHRGRPCSRLDDFRPDRHRAAVRGQGPPSSRREAVHGCRRVALVIDFSSDRREAPAAATSLRLSRRPGQAVDAMHEIAAENRTVAAAGHGQRRRARKAPPRRRSSSTCPPHSGDRPPGRLHAPMASGSARRPRTSPTSVGVPRNGPATPEDERGSVLYATRHRSATGR